MQENLQVALSAGCSVSQGQFTFVEHFFLKFSTFTGFSMIFNLLIAIYKYFFLIENWKEVWRKSNLKIEWFKIIIKFLKNLDIVESYRIQSLTGHDLRLLALFLYSSIIALNWHDKGDRVIYSFSDKILLNIFII